MIFPTQASFNPGPCNGTLPVIQFKKIIFTEAVTKMMLMIELFISHKEFANLAQQSK